MWSHLKSESAEKNRNRRTTIVHQKIFWKIYFLYDFLGRTNLFVPSRFWTRQSYGKRVDYTNFGTCFQR